MQTSSKLSLRINPSYGTVIAFNGDYHKRLALPGASATKHAKRADNTQLHEKRQFSKTDILIKCKQMEGMLRKRVGIGPLHGYVVAECPTSHAVSNPPPSAAGGYKAIYRNLSSMIIANTKQRQ